VKVGDFYDEHGKGQTDPQHGSGRVPAPMCFHELKYPEWPLPTYVHVKNIFDNTQKLAL